MTRITTSKEVNRWKCIPRNHRREEKRLNRREIDVIEDEFASETRNERISRCISSFVEISGYNPGRKFPPVFFFLSTAKDRSKRFSLFQTLNLSICNVSFLFYDSFLPPFRVVTIATFRLLLASFPRKFQRSRRSFEVNANRRSRFQISKATTANVDEKWSTNPCLPRVRVSKRSNSPDRSFRERWSRAYWSVPPVFRVSDT